MFPFFESIAIKNTYILNIDAHQLRIDRSFEKFYPGFLSHKLEIISLNIPNPDWDVMKLKFHYNHSSYFYKIEEYKKNIFENFYILPISHFSYNYKYSDRLYFESLKSKISALDEYIFTANNLITDTSYSNICLFDNQSWYTPNKTLLQGCMRSKLIKEKVIKPIDLHINDLSNFSSFKLVNALNDFNSAYTYQTKLIYQL